MKNSRVLLAGATGYLGRYIAHQLAEQAYPTRLIVRNKVKVRFDDDRFDILEAEVTKPESIAGSCKGIDVVISTVGITRQKDGVTYMDVDYQANVNLVEEAKRSGVRKFIYVSVFNGEKMRQLKICEAKERFVEYLQASGLDYCIIRPNGFFSDMGDFLSMAKSGRVFLFGDGEYALNPIHGSDLAKVCVDAIEQQDREICVGGPDILTQNEIAALALQAVGKGTKIIHLPDWIRKATIGVIRACTGVATYGPIEFFLTAMAMDNVAPQYGHHKLGDFFMMKAREEENRKST